MRLSHEDLIDQLRIKLKSLAKSCFEYDNGDYESSIDISTCIRVLIHDTNNSTSLLNQLGKKSIKYFNTSVGILDEQNELPQYTLAKQIINPAVGINFYPFIDNSIIKEWISFDNWWNETVIIIPKVQIKLTRKSICLKLANKYDAHIGTDIPKFYHDLFKAKDNLIGFTWFKGAKRIDHKNTPIFPTIRQIAHELIVSISREFGQSIDFAELYYKKLNQVNLSLDGVSNISIGTLKKSDSLINYESLSEKEKNEKIKQTGKLLNHLKQLYPRSSISNKDIDKILEILKPYSINELQLQELCENFWIHKKSFESDVNQLMHDKFELDALGLLRVSAWMQNDDYFIDEDPPYEWKALRKKYNKIITTHNKDLS